jgi:hypothetical protein
VAHELEKTQVHCSADIVIVIFERVDIRFPNVCIRGEVHDAPGFPGLEHLTKNVFVSQIASLEGCPLDCPVVACRDSQALLDCIQHSRQRLARMATDEACTTGYEDVRIAALTSCVYCATRTPGAVDLCESDAGAVALAQARGNLDGQHNQFWGSDAKVECDSPRSSAVPRSRRARRRNSGVDQDRVWSANSSGQTIDRVVGMDSLECSRSICMSAIDRMYARLDRDLTDNLRTGAPWE